LPEKSCWLTRLLTGEIFASFHGKFSPHFGPKKVRGNGRCRPAFSGGNSSSFFEEKFREKPAKVRAEKTWSVTGHRAGRLTTRFLWNFGSFMAGDRGSQREKADFPSRLARQFGPRADFDTNWCQILAGSFVLNLGAFRAGKFESASPGHVTDTPRTRFRQASNGHGQPGRSWG